MSVKPGGLSFPEQPVPADSPVPAAGEEVARLVAIPDHVLLRPIGRGSYGSVWLARNMMGVYRAVKIVFRRSFEDQTPFERELAGLRRFEPVSRSHESFLDVLHIGSNEQEGCFYYVMELGDDQNGQPLTDPATYVPRTLAREIQRRGRLTVAECVKIGLTLAGGLDELHRSGLVHRDIKPSNVIFVNGVAKLADIGLVADAKDANSYVGTEGFIPPEGPNTPQADIYSLGKVLYEASTGKDRQEFPEFPTRMTEFADREALVELNEVTLKACHQDRVKRYQTAADLQADLQLLASGQSVRRLHLLERRFANLRRIGTTALLVLLVLAGLLLVGYREWLARLERVQQKVGANVAYGTRAMESGDLLGALPFFAEALRLGEGTGTEELTSRLRFGSVLAQCPKLTHFIATSTRIDSVEFSPDGRRVLFAQHYGKVREYDLETGQPCSPEFGRSAMLCSAAYSPDGRYVLTVCQNRRVDLWDASNFALVRTWEVPTYCSRANFSPDGRHFAVPCDDGAVRIWSLGGEDDPVLIVKAHSGVACSAAFSPDGQMLVTCGRDNVARLWDSTTGTPIGQPLEHGSWVFYAAFSHDGRRLVTASMDRKARVWEVATGKKIEPDLVHLDGVKSAEFSPDGRFILTASWDGTARLWSAANLLPLRANPILRHGQRLNQASFNRNGHEIVTGSNDGSVRIWDLAGCASPPEPRLGLAAGNGARLLIHSNGCLAVESNQYFRRMTNVQEGWLLETNSLSSTGRYFIHAGPVATGLTTNIPIEIWDLFTDTRVGPPFWVSNLVKRVCVSGDGSLGLACEENVAHLWDTWSGKRIGGPLTPGSTIRTGCFSPKADILAIGSGHSINFWDTAKGSNLLSRLVMPLPVSQTAFSPDGFCIVGCCADNQLAPGHALVCNTRDGKPIGRNLQHQDGVLDVAFSRDSRRVVTTGEDFTAIVWEIPSGRRLTPALLHEGPVYGAGFSSNAEWLVTAGGGTCFARIWSTRTGGPLTPPLPHPTPPRTACFLADEHHIITTDLSRQVRVWELSIEQRPAPVLVLLSRLLSGNAVTLPGELEPNTETTLDSIWSSLRTSYPATFRTTPKEVEAWHRTSAAASEGSADWFAAVFHLERLLSLGGDPARLTARLTAAREHLIHRE